MITTDPNDVLINSKDAAEILRCSPQHVGNYERSGRLTAARKGGRGRGGGTWYRKGDVQALKVELEAAIGQDLDLAGSGPLANWLLDACNDFDLTKSDLLVMARQSDPFRYDTVGGHQKAKWFAELVERFLPHENQKIHIRGFHYLLTSIPGLKLPDGTPYVNSNDCYLALDQLSDCARWLGYVEFDKIVDNRNDPPFSHIPECFSYGEAGKTLLCGGHLDFTHAREPRIIANFGIRRQDYRICFIGEKSSLRGILQPIAEQVQGELLLPTGNLSNTMIAELETRANAEGRPLVVLYFSDFDPAGYCMPIGCAWKLHALKVLRGHNFDFQVYPVCLTKAQVEELGLPETPLKEGEKRKDKWKAAFGREQTEIDALAALQPDKLRAIAKSAVEPFYDFDLDRRLREAEDAWEVTANEALRAHRAYHFVVDQIALATEKHNRSVRRLNDTIADGERQLADAMAGLPELPVPEPEYATETPTKPLWSSDVHPVTSALNLIEYRKYAGDLEIEDREEPPFSDSP